MSLRHCQLLFVIAICVGAVSVVPSIAGDSDAEPRITVVAPHPVTQGNTGEYVVIDPGGTVDLTGWTLSDGHRNASLPSVVIDEPIAVSGDPRITKLLTDAPVHGWHGHVRLASGGDSLELKNSHGAVIDSVSYPDTKQAARWHRSGDEMIGIPASSQSFEFETHTDVEAISFVLPDGARLPDAILANASDRLWIAGYELTDDRVRNIVLDRHAAGIDVRILVDGNPVGGQSVPEVETLDSLDDAGVPVRVLAGTRDRFRFHHPKYAIVDDSAIVMTENWKPAGTGGASSRGWGIVLDDPRPTDELIRVFEADFVARDSVSWTRHRAEVDPRPESSATGEYPDTFEPAAMTVEHVQVAISPNTAEEEITRVIQNAEYHIDVQQVRISDASFPLVVELITAAERGVHVRILLDSSWYVHEENQQFATLMNDFAAQEGLPLEVRLVEPADRFGKIHTKGLIVDEEVTIVGSMNWNNVSMRDNREVLVVVESAAVGEYFQHTFDHDWAVPGTQVPIGMVVATILTWVGVGLFSRRYLSFSNTE